MKNSEYTYTRERFFELLSIHYPDVYQENGYIDFKDTDKKAVAEDLNMGSSQLSGFLNPVEKNSYKNIIKNLERFHEVKQLRKLMNRNKAWFLTCSIFGLIFIVSLYSFGITAGSSSQNQIDASPERVTTYEPRFQPNREQLVILLDEHFHHLNYWVATEVLAFYEDWKSGTVYAEENFDHELDELKGRVKNIILESRKRFRALEITGPSGENIVDFIPGTYNLDMELDRVFDDFRPSIEESTLSAEAMIDRIVSKSRKVQNLSLGNFLAKWDSSALAYAEELRLLPTPLPSSCLVKDETELDIVMRWHGENIINRLIWQAILENEKVKLGQTELENGLINAQSLDQLGETIFDIIQSGRAKLGDIGFETTTGYRLDSLIAEVFTKDRTLKILREKGVQVLSDTTLSFREIKDAIELMVLREQQESWKAMNKKAFGEGL